jgi:hypothetical protein
LGYTVKRLDNSECYDIDGETWECTCPDSVYRAKECKHAGAIKAGLRAIGQLRGGS